MSLVVVAVATDWDTLPEDITAGTLEKNNRVFFRSYLDSLEQQFHDF